MTCSMMFAINRLKSLDRSLNYRHKRLNEAALRKDTDVARFIKMDIRRIKGEILGVLSLMPSISKDCMGEIYESLEPHPAP